MMTEAGEGLGPTLKRLRSAARLTQEELAERSGISARTISDLERGLRDGVYPHTARRLAAALGLEQDAKHRFEAVAAGRIPGSPQATTGALPIPPTPLLGRADDVARTAPPPNDPPVPSIPRT